MAANPANTTMEVLGLNGDPILYTRSQAKLDEGLTAAQGIVKRDTAGNPSSTGLVGFLMIGNSNAKSVQAYYAAVYKDDSVRKLTSFKTIQAAQAGVTARRWRDNADSCWTTAANNVTASGCTAAQVQAAHVMMTMDAPATYGTMSETDVRAIVNNLVGRYPNVKIVYLSGMNYTGYSNPYTLCPEPEPKNNATLLSTIVQTGGWPCVVDFVDLWANGVVPHPQHGLAYHVCDVPADGVHPVVGASTYMGRSLHIRWCLDPWTTGWMRI
jgi:hypothetical protein